MPKFLFMFLLIVLACGSAFAQTYNTIRWPEQKVADKEFLAFTAGLGVASFADLRSTFQSRSSGYGVSPIMQPLASLGRVRAYATVGGVDFGLTALSYEGKKHHWRFWYMPEAVGIGAHGISFAWNIHIARQQ